MQALKQVFRNVGGLHQRIDTYLQRSSVVRVGLIAHDGRQNSKSVLEALLNDPVERPPWFTTLEKRPLTKDALITQSTSFEYTETHNSLVVYPLPFEGPPLEYLEVSDVSEARERLVNCHVLLDLFNGFAAPVNDSLVGFPRHSVIDCPQSSGASAGSQTPPLRINSGLCLEACAKLQASPSNADEFLRMYRASGIEALKQLLANRESVYAALKQSIESSCLAQIKEADVPSTEAEEAQQRRAEWEQEAYMELEGETMPNVRTVLYKDLAWWRLYWRSDDVAASLSEVTGPLPRSTAKYEFLLGMLSKASSSASPTSPASLPAITPAIPPRALETAQQQSLRAVLTALGVQIPIAICSGVLYLGGAPASLAVSLVVLGGVVGLRRLQTQWLQVASKLEQSIKESYLLEIRRMSQQLFELGERRAEDLKQLKKRMQNALAQWRA